MRDLPMPSDMAARWGHLPYLTYKGNNEWAAACPVCGDAGHDPGSGDPDRFFISAADGRYNARGKCRQCGHFEWVDEDKSQPPDPARIREMEELRREYAEQDRLRLQSLIHKLQNEAAWKGWHDAMKEGHRALWQQAGIPNEFQDYWQLGFTTYENKAFSSPALTIPYFDPGWQARNIQYRLTNPPQQNDKYRFQYGLRASMWYADPDKPPRRPTLLCEGMKKAAVVYINLVAKTGLDFDVVAVPSKTPGEEMLQGLAGCEVVYVIFDPDAYMPTKTKDGKILPPAVRRMKDKLGDRARYVRLPAKADDLFTQYRFTADTFMQYIKQATRTI